jgi:hypothetical protein
MLTGMASVEPLRDIAPLTAPEAVGAKLTLTVQEACSASDAGQLLVSVKLPSASRLLIGMTAVPTFVSVIACGALALPIGCAAKVNDEGENVNTPATPVPESATVCGEFPAPSVNTMLPARVPFAVGLKVTVTVHVAEAATDEQLFVCA